MYSSEFHIKLEGITKNHIRKFRFIYSLLFNYSLKLSYAYIKTSVID